MTPHEFILESGTVANSLFLTERWQTWLTTRKEEGWELLHGHRATDKTRQEVKKILRKRGISYLVG